ncbi:hypothetical protein [Tautonia rosea]|uniref:hypothetical protein n=1 Tax=Tautonia rosea TaxID=2728037 RepID=UPI001472BB0C|nr:hypothetical protein [Tautonia rosea]
MPMRRTAGESGRLISRAGRWAMVAVLASVGCGPSRDEAIEPLEGLFGEATPATVRIVHYHGETWGMDPSFAWVLQPIDNAYLKRLIAAKGLQTPPAGDRPASVRYAFPSWWDHDRIEALPEVYFDDSQGLRRIWVDRSNNQLFIEFIGT